MQKDHTIRKINPLKPPAYCLNCNYNLTHLTANQCPECGRTFDPDDHLTYLDEYPDDTPSVMSLFLCMLAFMAIFIVPFLSSVLFTLFIVFNNYLLSSIKLHRNIKRTDLNGIICILLGMGVIRDYYILISIFQ